MSPNDSPITVTAASGTKVYDGTALTADDFTVSGLPAGFSAVAAAGGAQTDAGSCANMVASVSILDAAEEDVTDCFSNVTTVDGTLTVTPAALLVTTGTAAKPYDGTALTAPAELSGLAAADEGRVTVTATGSQIDVGGSENSCVINWCANPANYTVTEELGSLTVTTNDSPITVTSASAEGTYFPAWPLTDGSFTVEGLPEGLSLHAEVTGSLHVGGTTPNTIESYRITDRDGADVTDFFTNVALEEGTLTLNKAPINIWSVSESFVYNGTWRQSHIYYQGAANSDDPMYQISHWDATTVRDVGTYEAGFTVGEVRADLQDRYELGTVSYGTITIERAQLSITAADTESTFTGDYIVPAVTVAWRNGDRAGETLAPTSTVVSESGDAVLTYSLFSSDTMTLTLHGLGREVGTYSVTGTVAFDSGATEGNYAVTKPSCRVTVSEAAP